MKRGIEASTTVQAPFERVRQVLSADPAVVMGADVRPGGDRYGLFRSELGVELPTGGALRKAVDIEAGTLEPIDGAASLPLSWRASGHDRLFPVFEGHLRISRAGEGTTRLLVHGVYVVPLGPVGRFGDGVIGRRLARQSLASFVEDAARRLDAEVHRGAATVTSHPTPYAVDLRELATET
ncbi:MAG TPA: hypothetical protein VFZ79_01055 [Acidimicrobiales bacterium]